jgi:cytochrome c553
MDFRPWVRVVEAEQVPQVRVTNNGLMMPIPDAPPMPLGQRIIEVPEYPERTEFMRDPRAGFIAYVPVGSLAKGETLVTTGGGKTIACGLCHGPEQTGIDEMPGIGVVPGIAGRTASYIMRQLWDIQQGTRQSPLMAPVVANLTAEDMLNITAYVTSLTP